MAVIVRQEHTGAEALETEVQDRLREVAPALRQQVGQALHQGLAAGTRLPPVTTGRRRKKRNAALHVVREREEVLSDALSCSAKPQASMQASSAVISASVASSESIGEAPLSASAASSEILSVRSFGKAENEGPEEVDGSCVSQLKAGTKQHADSNKAALLIGGDPAEDVWQHDGFHNADSPCPLTAVEDGLAQTCQAMEQHLLQQQQGEQGDCGLQVGGGTEGQDDLLLDKSKGSKGADKKAKKQAEQQEAIGLLQLQGGRVEH
eukprot:12934879-Prorocentrum_lima.AAC.1